MDRATEVLTAKVRDAVKNVPYFKDRAAWWSGKGKKIKTMADLIQCYYSSFSVVRIPVKGRYNLIHEQVGKLYDTIAGKCEESLAVKQQNHQDYTSEALGTYLQAGFDHFSKNIDVPFNFMDVALKLNPIPKDFTGHILSLAAFVRQILFTSDGEHIFRCISSHVASCIQLDIFRQKRPG